MNDFNTSLEDWDAPFQAAQAQEKKEYSEVPDGKYNVNVDRVEWKETRNGVPYLNWGLKILSGKYAGQFIWKKNFLTAESISFLKSDLLTIGVNIEKISKLKDPSILLDINIEANKKTKPGKDGGDFVNVYFNKTIKTLQGVPNIPENVDETDIPF